MGLFGNLVVPILSRRGEVWQGPKSDSGRRRNKKQNIEGTASGTVWAREGLKVKTGRVKSGRDSDKNHFIPDPFYFT